MVILKYKLFQILIVESCPYVHCGWEDYKHNIPISKPTKAIKSKHRDFEYFCVRKDLYIILSSLISFPSLNLFEQL